MRAAILVDEINAISQLHNLGIEGIRPWKVFYEALHSVLTQDYGYCDVSYRFYGAIPSKNVDKEKYFNRTRFFSALQKDDITVETGYCHVAENGKMFEKGVDVALALDLYDLSREGYDLLFVFSGDADLGPAIERAKKNQSKVVAILSEKQPAQFVKKLVDGVVPLEDVIDLIAPEHVLRRANKNQNQTN
jgi:uncharacterized LabA/DUF88 family protein